MFRRFSKLKVLRKAYCRILRWFRLVLGSGLRKKLGESTPSTKLEQKIKARKTAQACLNREAQLGVE